MIVLMRFYLRVFALPLKSKIRPEAENAILRHQLIVLERRMRGRIRLTNSDRLFFIWLYRWFPSMLDALRIIRTETPGAVARCRFSPLPALEVPIDRWSATNQCGSARVDPTDERRQSAVGRPHVSTANY